MNWRRPFEQQVPRARRWFDSRPSRERALLMAGVAALAFMLADAAWLAPAYKQWSASRALQHGAQAQLASLHQEFDRAQAQGLADDLRLRQEVATWRQRLAAGDEALRGHEASLVGPERMVQLLEQLLARHGELRVRSMQSLPKVEVLADAPAAPGTTSAGTGTPVLYRHGVELVLEGPFAELLSYLQALEALPQRLRWGDLQLRVEQHPRCLLTLRVYTLSLDRRWLEI